MRLLSIVLALIAKAYSFPINPDNPIYIFLRKYYHLACIIGYGFSYLVFIYALLSALVATFTLLRVTSWYDALHTEQKEKNNEATDSQQTLEE